MKYIYILFFIAAGFTSCSNEEDEIIPNVKDTSFYFAPNDTCTDAVSELRREFFKNNGSYLLFNDTIQHYFIGMNINGDSAYFTEKLDLSYSVGDINNKNTSYWFDLLPNLTRKQNAVTFMEENILYHFTTDLQPFSWILVNRIYCKYISSTTNPVAATGQRSIAVALENLPKLRTDAQKQNFIQQILIAIVNKVITDQSSKFADFTNISQNLYSRPFSGYDNATTDECLKYLYSKGFVSRGKNEYGITANGYYPTQSSDLGDYARMVSVNNLETIKTKYADYPIIIEKAKKMIASLEALGYVF